MPDRKVNPVSNQNKKKVKDESAAALAINQAFLDDNNKTNAEYQAQIIELTKQNNTIIRRVVDIKVD